MTRNAKSAGMIPRIRWLGIFLVFFTTPQLVFKFAAKTLRPVVNVAEDMVSTIEDLSDKIDS